MTDALLDLTGRTALVTGAGQGVGAGIANLLAAYGAKVAVNDFDSSRAETVAKQLRDKGAEAIAIAADVGDFDELGRGFDAARAALGPIDILVNNAGNRGVDGSAPSTAPFWEQSPSDWRPFMHVNVDGVMNATRHALVDMTLAGRGRVITLISEAGRVGEIGGLEVYSAAKAGAAGFTRAMARLGGRYNVTANCISLGATRTPATAAALDIPDFAKKVLSNYVIRRFGEPSDAANLALFLAGDASSWITGQTIPVNGGYSFTL